MISAVKDRRYIQRKRNGTVVVFVMEVNSVSGERSPGDLAAAPSPS
jgi:hypothetical protein